MNLINANIKSKKELAQRLIDGEVFYLSGSKVFYDAAEIVPFRLGFSPLEVCWGDYERMKKESNWWDNIPEEGVLCWVSDNDSNPNKIASRIIGVVGGEYLSMGGCSWTYASPVKPEECLQYGGDN